MTSGQNFESNDSTESTKSSEQTPKESTFASTEAALQVMSILHDATKGQPQLRSYSKPAGGLARSYLKISKL